MGDLLNAKGITWGSFEGGFNLQKVNPTELLDVNEAIPIRKPE